MGTSGGVASAQPAYAGLAAGEVTTPRTTSGDSNSAGVTPATGVCHFTTFRALLTGNRQTIRWQNGSVAPVTGTYAAVGLYSINAAGDVTLLAQSAPIAAWAGAFAVNTAVLASAVPVVAGNLYAVGNLQVATTPCSMQGAIFLPAISANAPVMARTIAAQAALPASVLNANLVGPNGLIVEYEIT